MRTRFLLEFHFCYNDPDGRDVIGFDVYFVGRCDGIWNTEPERAKGGKVFNELCLKAESHEMETLEAFEFVPIFPARYSRKGTRITLGQGKTAGRFPVTTSGSGGNWHWEVFTVPARRMAHVLNWLRRQKHFDISEWDDEFRDMIWDRRGSIRLDHLRTYCRGFFEGIQLDQLIALALQPDAEAIKC